MDQFPALKLTAEEFCMHFLMGLGILLLSSVGHAEFWVLFVNRIYSFRIDHRKLRILRRLHDVAVPLFPLFLLWRAGISENGLLVGGSLNEQSLSMQLIIGLTSLGVLPWLAGMLRWQWKLKHAFHRAETRQHFDLLKLAERHPAIGDVRGPRKHLLQKFPWNEIYTVEVNTKSIIVPRPVTATLVETSARRPLRIVHFSDLHFIGCPGEGFYRWVMDQAQSLQPDAFVFTGDLIDDPELMSMAAEILGSLTSSAPCFFVLGNHDWRYDHEELRRAVVRAGWIDVASQSCLVTLAGCKVLIAGSELPWLGQHPPTAHGTDCDLRLLLSHSPDQVGSAARAGYDVMLAGHTHGGQVVLPWIGPMYSPSIYGVRYASGIFQQGSLQMHVSRGVGAKDPVRWRCRPELTCLEIVLQPTAPENQS